ncbi:bifunctional nicotinamide-nucleotide adenylyltransferase/Nudix hydroxylase [Massilia sp. PAMC28688]|nr:bifunctional nicotinamide-nucleotide adenylyltransferase/Nudix hydroxylase [Massilia sp. PAMC28688]
MDVAVVIGRFQPFHCGHEALLRKALAVAPRVVVVLGSSFHARSAKSPFSWQERAAMIEAVLSDEERKRVAFVPVRDYQDDVQWAQVVQQSVEAAVPDAAQVAVVGFYKDASSYYLNRFPEWETVAVEAPGQVDAADIRRVYFEADDIDIALSVLEKSVPPAVRSFLKSWAVLPDYAALAEEHAFVQKYKAAWSKAPYAPIFSTVDAVVICADHVLLIKRGGFPGKGQWAVPGGFVEQRERLLQSTLRELEEETKLAVLASTMEAALVDVRVFDNPDRSQRGRTITHAHYFELQSDTLPSVEASDDAALVQWVAIADLGDMEEEFYEDHFMILDYHLHVSKDRQVTV